MMKKLLAALFSCCLLFACTEELVEHDSIRRIVNETKYGVEIEVFGDDDQYTYVIDPFDSLDIEGVCTSGVETYCELGWITSLDNATITFDDERIQTFDGLPVDKTQKAINADPGAGYGYTLTREGDTRIYTYRITEDDYDNAETIGG